MEKGTEIRSAIEELALMVKLKPGDKKDAAHIPTKPFLYVCNLIIQVLGWSLSLSLDNNSSRCLEEKSRNLSGERFVLQIRLDPQWLF